MFVPVRIFICYAHEDKRHLDKFLTVTKDLERSGVEFTYDAGVPWGAAWESRIHHMIDSAHLFVILLTTECIASSYCRRELEQAYRNRDAGRCQILPVQVGQFMSTDPRLHAIQWTPRGKPIAERRADRAWVEVAAALNAVVAAARNPVEGRPEPRRTRLVAWVLLVTGVLLTGIVWLVVASGKGSTADSDGPPEVVHTVDAYRLQVSSTPLTCYRDKFDLDTSLPGHGNQPKSLCDHGGGLAELILDPGRLHSPDDQPILLPVTGSADFGSCDKALRESAARLTGSLPLSELRPQSQLCVRTDEGLIAVVTILSESGETLAFRATVWRPR